MRARKSVRRHVNTPLRHQLSQYADHIVISAIRHALYVILASVVV
jgi:hypothetical protein